MNPVWNTMSKIWDISGTDDFGLGANFWIKLKNWAVALVLISTCLDWISLWNLAFLVDCFSGWDSD
jgi:hypothetical protein